MNDFFEKKRLLLALLRDNIDLLSKSNKILSYSQDRCEKLLKKSAYLDDELESCEALISRFARTTDLLTQKILTNIFAVLQETPKSFVDKCNLAEKLGIIISSEELQIIRGLRNEIAHEYTAEDIIELFARVGVYSYKLSRIVEYVTTYAQKLL